MEEAIGADVVRASNAIAAPPRNRPTPISDVNPRRSVRLAHPVTGERSSYRRTGAVSSLWALDAPEDRPRSTAATLDPVAADHHALAEGRTAAMGFESRAPMHPAAPMQPVAPMRRDVAEPVAPSVMSRTMARRRRGVTVVVVNLGLGDGGGEAQRRAEDGGGERATQGVDHAIFPFPPTSGGRPATPAAVSTPWGRDPASPH